MSTLPMIKTKRIEFLIFKWIAAREVGRTPALNFNSCSFSCTSARSLQLVIYLCSLCFLPFLPCPACQCPFGGQLWPVSVKFSRFVTLSTVCHCPPGQMLTSWTTLLHFKGWYGIHQYSFNNVLYSIISFLLGLEGSATKNFFIQDFLGGSPAVESVRHPLEQEAPAKPLYC